jgi:hypothetical protein
MERITAVTHIAVELLIASFLAVVVRTTTVELSQTLGTVWPFSLVHCQLPSALGCRPQDQVALTSSGKRFDVLWK